jgi:GPH family glycoside/pentoside/hexuronide:cation symporter
VAFIIVPPLSARLGKKNAAILLAMISMTFTAGLYGSWLLDLVPGAPNDPSILFMFALVAMTNSAAAGMMMLTSSMMADVVEASQQETGRRSEGLFFAGYFFMQKCAVGIGTFAAGMILTFADFPQNAVPGRVDVAVLDGLALYYMGTVLVLGIIGVLILRHFPISRESHNERLRVLNTAAESAS